jgi:hypothetical protein
MIIIQEPYNKEAYYTHLGSIRKTIIIIMKSSVDRDNNYCHYVILRNAGFAITLHYHPAGSIRKTSS